MFTRPSPKPPSLYPVITAKPAMEDLKNIKGHMNEMINNLSAHQMNKKLVAEAMKPTNELGKAIAELNETLYAPDK